jgi:membrane protein implicated in regulation of membrane protease activity
MVRYFYVWTPLIIVVAVALLSMPWLGLIALMVVAFAALVALVGLAWAIVFLPYMLGRAILRRLQKRSRRDRRTAPALSPATRQDEAVWRGPPSHAAALSVGRELQVPQDTFPEGYVS